MRRVNQIVRHPVFIRQLDQLEEAEKDRIFCRHTMEHFLDVARLMYIYALEEDILLDKELIYAAALMHDIGRLDQIVSEIPHEQAGAALCDRILPECEFSKEEIAQIKTAILGHRQQAEGMQTVLGKLLYRADKQSRCCFSCQAQAQCNWSQEKRNLTIVY